MTSSCFRARWRIHTSVTRTIIAWDNGLSPSRQQISLKKKRNWKSRLQTGDHFVSAPGSLRYPQPRYWWDCTDAAPSRGRVETTCVVSDDWKCKCSSVFPDNDEKRVNIALQWWARSRLKWQASRVFAQLCVQSQIKENIKALRHWPLWEESTSDREIPLTKDQYRGKCFPLMTSSWSELIYSTDISWDYDNRPSVFSLDIVPTLIMKPE